MHRSVAVAVLCVAVLCASVFGDDTPITVIAEEDQEININGQTHTQHTAEIQATQPGSVQYTVVSDLTQTLVEISCSPPIWIFTLEHVGYIPRALYRVQDENCLVLQQPNATAIVNEQNQLLGRNADGIPTGPIFSPVSSSTPSATSRVRLSAGRSRLLAVMKRYASSDQRGSPVDLSALENLEFSMQVGRITGNQRRLLQFVEGFIGGVVGGFLYNSLFGGGGDSGVDTALRDLAKQVNLQQTLNHQFQDFDENANREFALTYADLQSMQAQLDSQARVALLLNDSIYTEINVNELIASQVTSGFSAVGTVISQINSREINITNAMQTQAILMQQQMKILAAGTQAVDQQLTGLLGLAFRWYQQADMRRFLTTSLVQNSFTKPTDGIPTTPFTTSLGQAPLDAATRTAAKNLCNAPRVAAVNLLFTTGSYTANQVTFEFICDQDFILDNIFPFVDFKTLLYSIGPGAVGGQTCYHSPSTAGCVGSQYTNYAWNCSCVVRVASYSCTMNTPTGDKMWPFYYSDPAQADSLLAYDEAATAAGKPRVCAGSPGAVNNPTSDIPIGYLTGSGGFYDNLNQICTTIKGSAVAGSVTAGNLYKVRVTSRYHLQFTDLLMTSAELCSYNSNLFLDNSFQQVGLGYAIFRYWQLSYQMASATIVPALEQRWHGGIPTGVMATSTPIGRVPDSTHVKSPAQCVRTSYTRIYDDDSSPENNKLKVYVLRPVTVDHQLRVTVTPSDGDPVQPQPLNGSNSMNTALLPDGGGRVTLQTAVSLTADYASYLPAGDPMFVAGSFAVAGSTDVMNRRLIYDIPTWAWGAPGGCYRVNYLYESASWDGVTPTSLMNITTWMAAFGNFYDPDCADTSPHLYQREVDDATGMCGRFFDPRYPVDNETPHYIKGGLDYRMCEIMKRFQVEYAVDDDGQQQIIFSPRQFIVTGTLKFPKGKLIKQINTGCPAVSIDANPSDGVAVITMTTNSTSSVTVHFTVTSNSTAINCAQSQDVSLSASDPYQITVPACGLQYFNVREIGNTSWCFLNPIMLNVTQQTGGDENIGLATKSYFTTGIDTSVTAAHRLSVAFGKTYFRIGQYYLIAESIDQIQKYVQSQIQGLVDLQNEIAGVTANLTSFNQHVNNDVNELANNAQQITNQVIQQWTERQNAQRILQMINNSVGIGTADTIASNYTVQQLDVQNRITQRDVRNLKDKDCDDKEPPILGPMICWFEKRLASIASFIVWVVIVVIVACVCYYLLWPLAKKAWAKRQAAPGAPGTATALRLLPSSTASFGGRRVDDDL